MDTQQIADYLEKYNLKTKEQLAFHIEQLKRNTNPNLVLISELVWTLEDEFSFFNSFCAENKIKWFTNDDFIELTLQTPPQKSLNNHIINDEQQEKRSAEHLDEVLEELGKKHPLKINVLGLVFDEIKKDKQEQDVLKMWEQCVVDSIDKELPTYKKYDFSKVLDQWITNMTGEISAEKEIKTEENKGMSTRLKAQQEKEVIDNWEKTTNVDLVMADAISKIGKKETENKVDYSEINLEILDLMANRFSANKHKYPKGNMKKVIDVKSLEWALFRHVKKMIQPIETDEETYKDHLSAVLCNASMILDQLNGK